MDTVTKAVDLHGLIHAALCALNTDMGEELSQSALNATLHIAERMAEEIRDEVAAMSKGAKA